MNKKFYITTTLPYVNSDPHIGFALEIVQADAIARYHKLIGDELVFNTGTDEHGTKIYRAALEQKKDPQDYTDEYAAKFDKLKEALNLSYTNFIRTTEPKHVKAAQEFWKRCAANDDIYKDTYSIKYCVGCELEKTESELEKGKCPIHPNLEVEIVEEENYFFKWSKYQNPLLELYKANPNFVVPDSHFNEIRNFVKQGLKDFSISRLRSRLPWGVPVPGDTDHVMYVWFDALINYISTLGWPNDETNFKDFWPGTQVAGKDNVRQQSAMWQAMLLSAGLPNSKQIFIHGFITSRGQKISKSLGNTVDPFQLVAQYGIDPVRYYLLREIPAYGDGDFSENRFKELYNADLANGLGNLVARVAALCEKAGLTAPEPPTEFNPHMSEHLTKFQFNDVLTYIWGEIAQVDRKINEEKPWELTGEELTTALTDYVGRIQKVAFNLQPFLPETSEKILKQFSGEIKSAPPLFPRIE
ncbi:methionine--tRNA ligase [Candidatus Microgenomates bacterium]|nr:methionine--tRNA ligase [Candidatus Microgenomates bacterium]